VSTIQPEGSRNHEIVRPTRTANRTAYTLAVAAAVPATVNHVWPGRLSARPRCETQTVHLYQSAAAAATAAAARRLPVISQRYDVSIISKPAYYETTHGASRAQPGVLIVTE